VGDCPGSGSYLVSPGTQSRTGNVLARTCECPCSPVGQRAGELTTSSTARSSSATNFVAAVSFRCKYLHFARIQLLNATCNFDAPRFRGRRINIVVQTVQNRSRKGRSGFRRESQCLLQQLGNTFRTSFYYWRKTPRCKVEADIPIRLLGGRRASRLRKTTRNLAILLRSVATGFGRS